MPQARTAKIAGSKLGARGMQTRRTMPDVADRCAARWSACAQGAAGVRAGGVSSFIAYDLEKRVSKHPEKFGTGVIEGVAAPEAANNATAQTGFIPLFAFGIPTSASTAIILAALMIYGAATRPGTIRHQQAVHLDGDRQRATSAMSCWWC